MLALLPVPPHQVSILARPEGRAPPDDNVLGEPFTDVSILARPEGRAPRAVSPTCETLRTCCFNPRRARPEGRAPPGGGGGTDHPFAVFNPRPTRRPGSTVTPLVPPVPVVLFSILARPEGGALPPAELAADVAELQPGFNPRPTRRPGATTNFRLEPRWYGSFNPRPTRRPGATPPSMSRFPACQEFQSSPDPKAGRHRDK